MSKKSSKVSKVNENPQIAGESAERQMVQQCKSQIEACLDKVSKCTGPDKKEMTEVLAYSKHLVDKLDDIVRHRDTKN